MRANAGLTNGIAHLAFACVVGMLAFVTGRPLHTADAWLHLKLGEAYAAQGPWLDSDPILYTAEGPPTATAWVSDLLLHGLHLVGGFPGLRVGHVLLVLTILWLAHSLFRRESCVPAWASFAAVTFVALAGFRLYQLRPQLVTIAFVMLLYRLLLESRQPPGALRIAGATLLMALWANMHAGFLLGPLLLAAGLAGVLIQALLGAPDERAGTLARARGLGIALGLGTLASLANPDGVSPHLSYFAAGNDSPALDFVLDEWRAFPFFGPIRPGLPPSPLDLALGWALIPGAALLGGRWLLQVRSGRGSSADPALIGVACAGALAATLALRFQWLGIFSLLLVASTWRLRLASTAARRGAAAGTVAMALAWVGWGSWPALWQSTPHDRSRYAQAHATTPFHGHAAWLLRDARIEGNLYNRYVHGNYLGFWLAPALRPFIGGSLNVPPHVADAYGALNDRRGVNGLGFEETLDRYQVDVFMGVGVPTAPVDGRPRVYTTAHLEGVSGWIPIFRNLRTSLWLRDDARNAHNLDRIADHYRREGVPFDRETGFEPATVVRASPRWAARHGMVPADFAHVRRAASTGHPAARQLLALTFAALGHYEGAVEIDRSLLAAHESLPARRRLVWCLLRLGQLDAALEAAAPLAALDAPRSLGGRLAEAATHFPALTPAERATRLAELVVFSARDFETLFTQFVPAQSRSATGDTARPAR